MADQFNAFEKSQSNQINIMKILNYMKWFIFHTLEEIKHKIII